LGMTITILQRIKTLAKATHSVFLTGTLIQTIILENNPNYAFPAWQGSLLVIANIAFTIVANIRMTRYIPRVQTLFFVLHILTFFAVMIPICINAPKASASDVFTKFENRGGWSSVPFATLAGQLSAIYMMGGTDSAAHLSEEVKDASKCTSKLLSSHASSLS
jgi:choline transport protein